MKKTALITTLICAIALLIFSAPTAYSQTIEMSTTNYSYYINTSGSLIVVGEVQNTGTQTIGSAVITGVVYTSDGEIQAGTEYSLIYATEIPPAQTAPFYMKFSDQDANFTKIDWTTKQIQEFKFNYVTNPNSTQQYSELHIGGDTSYIDSTGNYTVNGIVLNRGTSYPQNIWVVAAFYDSAGKVIAAGYSNYLTHYLAPNDVAQFTLAPTDSISQMSTQISSYKLQVLSSGTMDSTPPTPIPSLTPSAIPLTYLYAIVAAIIIVVVVVLAIILRRR
jgi:hypothetical protein